MMRNLHTTTAAGTALTNSTSETVLDSYTLPAYSLQAGKRYRASGFIRTTAQNSTDTLTVRVRIGPTTLIGTAVLTSAAVDQAVSDVCPWEVEFVARDADSSSTLAVRGSMAAPDGSQTLGMLGAASLVSSIDATAAQLVEVTGEWSVANAGNSCQSELMIVDEIAD